MWLWERKWGPTMRACLLVTSRIKCLKNIKEESQTCTNVTSMTSLAPPLILDKIWRTSYIFVQPIILLLSILLRFASLHYHSWTFVFLFPTTEYPLPFTTKPQTLTNTSSILPPTRLIAGTPFHSGNSSVCVGFVLMMGTMISSLPKWRHSLSTEATPKNLITTSRQRAKGISWRRALRKNNSKHSNQRSGKVPLELNFHPRNKEVKKILLTNFRIRREDPTTAHIFNNQPLCVHRRETNHRDILVHSTFASRPEQDQAPPGTFPCNRPRCRTCSYTAKTNTIISKGGSVHLKRRFNCTATGVVYAILCQRCHILYIGETSRKLANRFGEHLPSVEGYNHNSRYHGGGFPMAELFNLADHNNIQDMKVSVVKQAVERWYCTQTTRRN